MKLYHGTDAEAAEQIEEQGFDTDMVFMTATREAAEGFGDGTVVECYVSESDIRIDFDHPGQATSTVAEANVYANSTKTVSEWLESHHAFAAPADSVEV